MPTSGARHEHEFEAVIDTGYTSSLTLAPATIAMLGLPLRTRSMAMLANGAIVAANVYAGTVIWDGVDRSVLIHEFDAVPLVGMGLLRGYDLGFASRRAAPSRFRPSRSLTSGRWGLCGAPTPSRPPGRRKARDTGE